MIRRSSWRKAACALVLCTMLLLTVSLIGLAEDKRATVSITEFPFIIPVASNSCFQDTGDDVIVWFATTLSVEKEEPMHVSQMGSYGVGWIANFENGQWDLVSPTENEYVINGVCNAVYPSGDQTYLCTADIIGKGKLPKSVITFQSDGPGDLDPGVIFQDHCIKPGKPVE